MCVLRVRPSHSPLRVGRGALFPPNAACINKRTIPSQLANKRGILLCTQPQPPRLWIRSTDQSWLAKTYSCVISNSCSCQCLLRSPTLCPPVQPPPRGP